MGTKIALLVAFGSAAMLRAGTITETLGASAGFANGSTNARVGAWNTATAGNPAPFNGYNGNNVSGPNFSASWTFDYGAIVGTITDATLEIGIYDIDSKAALDEVASYTEGSVDLTSLLNAVANALNGSTGAVHNEYDLLTITLPSTTYADLATGDPTFSLALQGPGLGTLGNTTYDGAGIDLSTISIDTQAAGVIPEPATWALLLTGLTAIAGLRRLRRR